MGECISPRHACSPIIRPCDVSEQPLDMPTLFIRDPGGPGLLIEPSFVTIGDQLAEKHVKTTMFGAKSHVCNKFMYRVL